MTLWCVCLATLALAAWADWRVRRIPAWLPLAPVVAAAILWPATDLWGQAALLLGFTGLAVVVLLLAQVGIGDVALAGAVSLALGPWVLVVLAVALAAGAVTLARRHCLGDPFVPHLLAGFLLASGLRWATGG